MHIFPLCVSHVALACHIFPLCASHVALACLLISPPPPPPSPPLQTRTTGRCGSRQRRWPNMSASCLVATHLLSMVGCCKMVQRPNPPRPSTLVWEEDSLCLDRDGSNMMGLWGRVSYDWFFFFSLSLSLSPLASCHLIGVDCCVMHAYPDEYSIKELPESVQLQSHAGVRYGMCSAQNWAR